jgi:hypothetical protein
MMIKYNTKINKYIHFSLWVVQKKKKLTVKSQNVFTSIGRITFSQNRLFNDLF